MLARQQATSSEGGFAKLAHFSFFLFIFLNIFFLFFLFLHMGSQGWFGHCYGWVGVFRLGSSSGVKPASQYW